MDSSRMTPPPFPGHEGLLNGIDEEENGGYDLHSQSHEIISGITHGSKINVKPPHYFFSNWRSCSVTWQLNTLQEEQ